MNTTELTLEMIAPYLPYGLKAYIFPDDFDLTSAVKKHIGLQWAIDFNIDTYSQIIKDGYKPILRPLSLLTQTIKIDGVECVPLIELAKIRWGFEDWWLHDIHGMKIARADTILNRWFDFEDGVFKAGDDDGNFHVKNQLQLFQYLFKHKFDVFGLIESGLALDSTTIKEDVY